MKSEPLPRLYPGSGWMTHGSWAGQGYGGGGGVRGGDGRVTTSCSVTPIRFPFGAGRKWTRGVQARVSAGLWERRVSSEGGGLYTWNRMHHFITRVY